MSQSLFEVLVPLPELVSVGKVLGRSSLELNTTYKKILKIGRNQSTATLLITYFMVVQLF